MPVSQNAETQTRVRAATTWKKWTSLPKTAPSHDSLLLKGRWERAVHPCERQPGGVACRWHRWHRFGWHPEVEQQHWEVRLRHCICGVGFIAFDNLAQAVAFTSLPVPERGAQGPWYQIPQLVRQGRDQCKRLFIFVAERSWRLHQ